MSKIFRNYENMIDMRYKRYIEGGTCYFILFIWVS